MNKLKLRRRTMAFLIFLLGALISSCDGLGGSDTIQVTEGFGGVELSIQGSLLSAAGITRAALGDSVSIAVTDTAGTEIGTLVLTEARFALNEIELEQEDSEIDTPEEEAQSLEVEFEGPFIISLLEGTILPEIPYVEVLPGTYDSLELKLEKIETEEETALLDAGDPLIGNSIYMTGSYSGTVSTGTVTDMPVRLSFDLDEEFELLSEAVDYSGFLIDEGTINSLIIAFRLDEWFTFSNTGTNSDLLIDFGDLVPVGDGSGGFEIVLDSTQTGNNETIREIIKDNVKDSADYGEDADDDGVLDPDEDED